MCRKHFSHSDAEGNLQRQSGKRHSLSHSDNHMSVVVADHEPPNVSKSSVTAKLYIFEDNASVMRVISIGRSPNSRTVSRTHRVDLDWLLARIIMQSL